MADYLIEIWNRDFEEPKRVQIVGSSGADDATARFRGLCEDIETGREQGEPLKMITWTDVREGHILVEPANVTKVTISGPGLDLSQSF